MNSKQHINKEEFKKFDAIIENQNELSSQQVETLKGLYTEQRNLLFITLELGTIEAVKFLLKIGFNSSLKDDCGFTVSDHAWEKNKIDCLFTLLAADAPLPKKLVRLGVLDDKMKAKIDNIMDDSNTLHTHIANGDFAKVEALVTKNSFMKVAYNKHNRCALATALIKKQFKIHSFLRSKDFSLGIDDSTYNELFLNLDRASREEIRKENCSFYPKNSKHHIFQLLSKTRLEFGNCKDFLFKIQEYYETLDSIEWIHPIFEIVASSEDADIVFDFTRSGVNSMDPTVGEQTKGLTYSSGYILIGAKNEYYDLLGVIAHEFCHYAMQLVYNNKKQPFKKNDTEKKQKYEEIVIEYGKDYFRSIDDIIDNVYSCYVPNHFNEELIVRVPHLLALYSQETEKLKYVRESCYSLFNFFEDSVLPDLVIYLNLNESKQKIKDINEEFKIFSTAEQQNFLSPNLSISIDIEGNTYIESPLPELVLESLILTLGENDNQVDSKHIFMSLEHIVFEQSFETMQAAAFSEIKPFVFIINTEISKQLQLPDRIHEVLRKINTVLISKKCPECFKEYLKVKHIEETFRWNHLSNERQSQILSSYIQFQNEEVSLRELLDEKLLENLSLDMIWDSKAIKLQTSYGIEPKEPRVFIERNYKLHSNFVTNNESNLESGDDVICKWILNHGSVMIADTAGTGKSTSAAKIAQQLKKNKPLRWVVFIDLKLYGFHRDILLENNIASFLKEVLKCENQFEQQLFKSFYENKKAIFVIDGFDEINTDYQKFLIDVMISFQKAGNNLLITTRPHCALALKNELELETVELVPFTQGNEHDFLMKYWDRQSTGKDFDRIIRELLNKIRFLLKSYDFYSTPIHIFMFAEIYDGQSIKNIENLNFNIFMLYKRFFTMKFATWIEKGALAATNSAEMHLQDSILFMCLHKIALEQIVDVKDLAELYLSQTLPEDMLYKITCVGVIAVSKEGRIQFLHRSYAEYFAADFIFTQAICKNPKGSILNLLIKVLIEDKYIQIRKFMNDRLDALKEIVQNKTLAAHVARELRVYYYGKQLLAFDNKSLKDIFCCLIPEQQTHLIRFILVTLSFDSKLKLEVVKSSLRQAGNYLNSFVTIWRCVEEFMPCQKSIRTAQKDIVLEERYSEGNVLKSTIRSEPDGKVEVTEFLIGIAENLLEEKEFLNFLQGGYRDRKFVSIETAVLTLLTYLVELFLPQHDFDFPFRAAIQDAEKFSIIWKAIWRKLGQENRKCLLMEKSSKGKTSLHCDFGSVYEIIKFLEIIKTSLSDTDFNNFLISKDSEGQIFLYYTLKINGLERLKMIWKFIDCNANELTKKHLILGENSNKNILIETLDYENCSVQLIDYLFDITESLLLKENKDIVSFLEKRDTLATIILRIIAHSKAFFLKFVGKIDRNLFRAILLKKTKGFKNMNILFLIVDNEIQDDAIDIWNLVRETLFDHLVIEKLFFDNRNYLSLSENVFLLAARGKNRIFLELFHWYIGNFYHEYQKKIFYIHDSKKSSILHLLAEYGDELSVSVVIKCLSDNFSLEENLELCRRQNDSDKIPLKCSLRNKNFEVVKEVWKFYCQVFDRYFLINVISQSDFALREHFQTEECYFEAQKMFLDWKLAADACNK